MTIGERIKARRKELNLTLKDLNQLTKISTGNLSELENGKYLPGVPALLQLSEALNCSTDWIIKGNVQTHSCFLEPSNDYNIQLTSNESEILQMYRALDERDKKDVDDMIHIKFSRNKR